MYGRRDTPRERLREELVELLRTYTVDAQHLAHDFAQQNRLHPTDLEALIAVMHGEGRGTPLTPGRLGEELGLSSGATTAVVDRLERVGHLRRVRESADRRVVHLRYADRGKQLAVAFWGPLGRRSAAVMDTFTEAELRTVRRFLAGMVETLHPDEPSAGEPQRTVGNS